MDWKARHDSWVPVHQSSSGSTLLLDWQLSCDNMQQFSFTSCHFMLHGSNIPRYSIADFSLAYSTSLVTTINAPCPESASELYRSSDRRLSAKVVPTFAYRVCHVVSVTDHYGRILDFIDRSRYVFFQVAPQLFSRGWVDPVPEPLLLRKSGSAGNGIRTSGSEARSSDHWTTEAVL
jgi:hypothetical protein